MLPDAGSSFPSRKSCTQLEKESTSWPNMEWAATKWNGISLPAPLPCCIKVKPLGLVTRIFLCVTTWVTCQCHWPWGLQPSWPLGWWEPWHFLPWDVLWDPTCTSLPIQEGLCPKHTWGWAFWNCCLQALHPTYSFSFLWNRSGTLAKKSSIGTSSRKIKQQKGKLGTSEE